MASSPIVSFSNTPLTPIEQIHFLGTHLEERFAFNPHKSEDTRNCLTFPTISKINMKGYNYLLNTHLPDLNKSFGTELSSSKSSISSGIQSLQSFIFQRKTKSQTKGTITNT